MLPSLTMKKLLEPVEVYNPPHKLEPPRHPHATTQPPNVIKHCFVWKPRIYPHPAPIPRSQKNGTKRTEKQSIYGGDVLGTLGLGRGGSL
eukprot:382119-Amphidinium_carterae.1